MAVLARIDKFFQPGITVVRDVPVIANINAPTRIELNAGTTVTRHIRGQAGFSVTSTDLDGPDLGSRTPDKVPGPLEIAASSFDVYLARNGIDIRTVWARDDDTFVVIQYGGDVATYPMDIFRVRVSATPKASSMDAIFGGTVQFSVSEVAEDVPTPAAA